MKQEKLIHGEIRSEITLGKPAIIHRDDQAPGEIWRTGPVEKINSMIFYKGQLGVKFETANTVYTVVQIVNK